MKRLTLLALAHCCALALPLVANTAQAADWSDTAIGWRAGDRFREPYNPEPIGKNILSLTHASGYASGNLFVNLDVLKSDKHDPASTRNDKGALEAYLTARYTFDLGKLSGKDLGFGPVRGVGLATGLDWNMKHDAAYNSRKRMFVLGPQLMWNVPGGRFNSAVLMAWESNAPHGPYPPVSELRGRYHYQAHAMLALDWAVPLGERWTFEGYANYIAPKGRDETGHRSGAETNIDARVMLDAGALLGSRPRAFLVGAEYQYWRNKFGNTRAGTGGKGYIASTPMLRAEYHF